MVENVDFMFYIYISNTPCSSLKLYMGFLKSAPEIFFYLLAN